MPWKCFEIKSHQRRAHYLNPSRNGGQLAARGGVPEPPSLIRVKHGYRINNKILEAVLMKAHLRMSLQKLKYRYVQIQVSRNL